MIIRTTGTYSLSKTIGRVKSITSNYLWDRNPSHFKRFYWRKNKKLLWSGGYYVATIGDVSVEHIERYLKKTRLLEVTSLSSAALKQSPFSRDGFDKISIRRAKMTMA